MSLFWKRKIFLMTLAGLISQSAGAQESPSIGLLYSQAEDHAITYHCAADDAKLNCDFVQMMVKKKIKTEELSQKSPEASIELPSALVDSEREKQTCLVSANAFRQSLTWTGNYGGGHGAWVVTAQPEGTCGVMQMSRFEVEKKINGFTFWKYVARKAVTKPEGMIKDHKCGETLDQGEYVYDWVNTRSSRMGCEFIEFSPL